MEAGQQAGPSGPSDAPLQWGPPVGAPPVFTGGGETESANPWRGSFMARNSVPASEAGPAPS
eukprot:14000398-Alexandrium_andersonii.AAC.1